MSMLPVQTDWIPASTPTFTLCVGQVALALDTQFGKRRKVVSVPLCWGLSELTPVVLETVLASPQKSELFLALCMFIYCFKGIGYVFLQKKHITISTIVKKKKKNTKKTTPSPMGTGLEQHCLLPSMSCGPWLSPCSSCCWPRWAPALKATLPLDSCSSRAELRPPGKLGNGAVTAGPQALWVLPFSPLSYPHYSLGSSPPDPIISHFF